MVHSYLLMKVQPVVPLLCPYSCKDLSIAPSILDIALCRLEAPYTHFRFANDPP